MADASATLLAETIRPYWDASYGLSGSAAAVALQRGRLRAKQARFTMAFDLTDPNVVTAARTATAHLIREVSADTKEGVRQLIVQGVQEGIAPRALRSRIMEVVGLTSRQMGQVGEYRAGLVTDGIDGADLDRKVSRFTDKLRRQRALLIARTEILRASNLGQDTLWRKAVADGYLPDSIQRRWNTEMDGRQDPICEDLNGEVVGLDEDFPGGYEMPPAHVSCRCSLSLVIDPVEPEPTDDELLQELGRDFSDLRDTADEMTGMGERLLDYVERQLPGRRAPTQVDIAHLQAQRMYAAEQLTLAEQSRDAVTVRLLRRAHEEVIQNLFEAVVRRTQAQRIEVPAAIGALEAAAFPLAPAPARVPDLVNWVPVAPLGVDAAREVRSVVASWPESWLRVLAEAPPVIQVGAPPGLQPTGNVVYVPDRPPDGVVSSVLYGLAQVVASRVLRLAEPFIAPFAAGLATLSTRRPSIVALTQDTALAAGALARSTLNA